MTDDKNSGTDDHTDDPSEGLFALKDDGTLNRLKEIKVKLPVSHHIKLHSLKITQNQPISEVVRQALEEYFSRYEAPVE